jgi:DNA-binding CsgD family transcriptional regulator
MKESARILGLAPSTLSAHKQRIMKKLGLTSSREFNNFLQAFMQTKKSLTTKGEAIK